MENKNSRNLRRKFQIGIITFAVIFFMVMGCLTYFSTRIDSLLYPSVTAANSSSGVLNPGPDYDPYFGNNTLIPSSSVHNGEVLCLKKDSSGKYYEVYSMTVDIIDQNALQTEIPKIDGSILVVCDSNKDIKIGDKVLVRSDIL